MKNKVILLLEHTNFSEENIKYLAKIFSTDKYNFEVHYLLELDIISLNEFNLQLAKEIQKFNIFNIKLNTTIHNKNQPNNFVEVFKKITKKSIVVYLNSDLLISDFISSSMQYHSFCLLNNPVFISSNREVKNIFSKLTYVYPVISRRSGGFSLGINLNTNNACNWRCIYCKVDNLIRDKVSTTNLLLLEQELNYILNLIVNSNIISSYSLANEIKFTDICIAGNGEPTMSNEFLSTIKIISRLRNKYNLHNIKTILITNGSLIEKPEIQLAIKTLSTINGEVWFKIDSANNEKIKEFNQVDINIEIIKKRFIKCSKLCKTSIQTCVFYYKNNLPSKSDIESYMSLIIELKNYIHEVLLYSTSKPIKQSEGVNIVKRISKEYLENLTIDLKRNNINAKYFY